MPFNSSRPDIQLFTFYISGEIFAQFLDEFSQHFTELTESRERSIAAPSLFFEDEDEEGESFSIGGELKVLNAWRGKLNREDDLRNYYDVKILIDFLSAYSFRYSAEIEFELADDQIGSITDGNPCESLSVGLLKEWEKKLGLQ
ncbi:hypothetical protein ACMDCR_31385 [Labrys okinawensis]|uniref:hypothetical protein n=1 Tax=Labrys okinawensis TaxID=346911 RepID=UPI0039BCF0E1